MRLHLTYREEAFPPAILDLTKRFMELKPWKPKTPIGTFNLWTHGAALCFDIPEVDCIFKRHPAGIGNYVSATEDQGGGMLAIIELHKPSMISVFHQFRHHMQANAEYHYSNDTQAGQDAQAWAASLYYVVDPVRFRRAVRNDLIAGVNAGDLLKKRSKR